MKISYLSSLKKVFKLLFDTLIATPIKIIVPMRNVIIFESHSDFCDNSKALYNYMIKQKLNHEFKIYWLVENVEYFQSYQIENVEFIGINEKSLLKRVVGELKRAMLFPKCKYYFFTHINFARSKPKKGQVFFNLTHGLSLKNTVGLHSEVSKSSYILSTSDFAANLRAKTYGGGGTKIRVLGFPRNDLLFEGNNTLEKLGISTDRYEKIVLWMPTFRRQKHSNRNDTGTTSKSDIPLIKNNNEWFEIEKFLADRNVLLIIKPHPAQDMSFFKNRNNSNIRIITNDELIKNEIELYHLIGKSNSLITDYSSVFVDYLVLNRPIGFTVDDISQYSKNLGFLVPNPLDYMPGPKIKDTNDLIEFISDVCKDNDTFLNKREEVRSLFHKYIDSDSSERVLNFLGFQIK